MTTDRKTAHSEEGDDTLGVLDATGAIDTSAIGLLGGATAQVAVDLPEPDEDDLDVDDVVADDAYGDLVLESDPAALVREPDEIGLIHAGSGIADIVIEIPAAAAEEPGDEDVIADETVSAEIVDEPEEPEAAEEPDEAEADEVDDEPTAPAVAEEEPDAGASDVPVVADHAVDGSEGEPLEEIVVEDDAEAPVAATDPVVPAAARDEEPVVEPAELVAEPAEPETIVPEPAPAPAVATVPRPGTGFGVPALFRPERSVPAPAPVRAPEETAPIEMTSAPVEATAMSDETPAPEAPSVPETAPELGSRRLDQFGDRERESADLLTADRLLDPHKLARPEPEGAWSHLLYVVSGRRINIGDGRRARERKALTARIAAPLEGTARFVPVLSRKGGVGKTTVTALLGMALADARDDRVIAVDANPDRGTLADRIVRTNPKTVRDLVRIHDRVDGYHDISAVVSRDATRLDVLASDADPRISEAFNDADYERVAAVAARYYSLVLTDTGTGIVHAVMGATLEHADTLVIVAGLSVDEARLASETITWLEANGYADKVRGAVVVLNQSTPGAPLVRLGELEAHFGTRVGHVVRIPYDPAIAAGSTIGFAGLLPETRSAARDLAALVVEGLRARSA